MNDKIIEFISNIDSNQYDEYANNVSIDSKLEIDDEINKYDYSWLNQVEKYLPFLNTIVNGKYLSMDPNVLKSYENRFIKTLIYRLSDFLLTEQKRFLKKNFTPGRKRFTTSIKTLLDNETIEVNVDIKTIQNEDLTKGTSYGLSLKERIERSINITNELLESNFIKLLDDVSFVHTPINKTPVFEEEINYRKALELFNFIDNYGNLDNSANLKEVKKNLEEKALITSFLEYQTLKDSFLETNDENLYRTFLERLIEKMVLESSMDEKNFKRMLTKKFEDEYAKKKNREKNIQNIFIKNIDNYNKEVKDALRALKN